MTSTRPDLAGGRRPLAARRGPMDLEGASLGAGTGLAQAGPSHGRSLE